jgi:argininosuccinate synthase
VQSTQRHVTGEVRVRLAKGSVMTLGRRAERSLYSQELATYNDDDQFDHSDAEGFIRLHGLQTQVQAHRQLLTEPDDLLHLASGEQPRRGSLRPDGEGDGSGSDTDTTDDDQ